MTFSDEGERTVFIDGKREFLCAWEGRFLKLYEIHSYKDRGAIRAKVLVARDRFVKDYREEYCKNKTMYHPSEFLKNKEINRKNFLRGKDRESRWDFKS
jgi:hypothetical protein